MRDILLLGGGGHCKSVIDVLEAHGQWRVAGIVERHGSQLGEVMGYPVVGSDLDLENLRGSCEFALVTLGQIMSPVTRQRLFHQLRALGFALPSIVSPSARVARSARLGEGTIVMHAAHVGPDARIGANAIINTRALVEHDAVVGDHCHVATHAVLNGAVSVADGCLIGSGAVCREGVAIGARSIVGMGSRVRSDLPEGSVFIGEPAR